MKKKLCYIGFILFCMPLASNADANVDTSGLQISVYGGRVWTDIDPSYILLDGETDALIPNSSQTRQQNFTDGFGTAYRFVMPEVKQDSNYLLHDIAVGLDFFAFHTSQNGELYQYRLPQYNNYTYHIPLRSRRLMLDTEWTFHSVYQVYPFLEAGLGSAWNTASYSDTPNSEEFAPGLTINQHTKNQFAYALGGGAKFPITKACALSLQYLYTHIGEASTGSSSNLPIRAPLEVKLKTQSVLLGFTYSF